MTEQNNLSELQQLLFRETDLQASERPIPLEDILSGKIFSDRRYADARYHLAIPLEEHWDELSLEAKLAAYATAVRAANNFRSYLRDFYED